MPQAATAVQAGLRSRRVAGIPRRDGGGAHRGAGKSGEVLARLSGEVAAVLERDDSKAANCRWPRCLSGARSDLHDHRSTPQMGRAARCRRIRSQARPVECGVGSGTFIEAPRERVSLAGLPRFRCRRAHAHHTEPRTPAQRPRRSRCDRPSSRGQPSGQTRPATRTSAPSLYASSPVPATTAVTRSQGRSSARKGNSSLIHPGQIGRGGFAGFDPGRVSLGDGVLVRLHPDTGVDPGGELSA